MKRTGLGTRTGRLAALAVGSVVLALLVPVGSASGASVSTSRFEIDTDANLLVDGAAPAIDWLAGGAGSAMRAGVVVKADDVSGATDSAFSSGTKEDSIVPLLDNGGIPPNKSDLKNFGVFKEAVGAKSYLHLFWARVQDPSGTTNMDFEFNQSKNTANDPAGSPQIVPVRTAGDLLITYDLSRGGTQATISKRTWSGSAWGPSTQLTGAQAIGSINTSAIAAGGSGGLGSLSPRTFGEASIDLSTVLPTGTCTSFGSAYLKSRSSDSFTSALKDFVPPQAVNISNCASIKVSKTDQAGAPLGGAEFTLYNDNATVGGTRQANDTITSPVLKCTTATIATPTQPVGECTIANVPLGNYWLVETGVPANYAPAADSAVAITSPDTVVNVTKVNVLQTGTVNILKTDDATPAKPLAGAVFTLFTNNTPTAGPRGTEDTETAYTCTTVAAGTCSISNVLLGSYWAVETTTPANHATADDQAVVITTGGQTVSLTFVDKRDPGSILIHKQDDAGTSLAGAVFTLYTDASPLGGSRGAEDTATALTCTTAASTGDCTLSPVPMGQYWVVETTTPTNYQTAPDQNVTLATAAQVVGPLTFVDPRDPGTIQIQKRDDDNPAVGLQGAVFTLYTDTSPFGGTRGGEDTITALTCTTAANGNCSISNVPQGQYWVVETTTPTGHVTASDQNATVSTAGQVVGPLTFVDNRLFKIITIVCKVADGSLYPSDVSYDGSATSASTLGAAPSFATEAQLCGLGGATTTVQKGAHSSSINVPQ